jgi:hypothetical protein
MQRSESINQSSMTTAATSTRVQRFTRITQSPEPAAEKSPLARTCSMRHYRTPSPSPEASRPPPLVRSTASARHYRTPSPEAMPSERPDFNNCHRKYEKKKVTVPPTVYDLQTVKPHEVIRHLDALFHAVPNAAETEYVYNFKKTLQQRGYATYGYIPAPPVTDVTRRVVGKDGYFFKMTTTLCGIDFIWHDRKSGIFHFWGATTFKVVKALNSIRWRIHKVYQEFNDESEERVKQEQYEQEGYNYVFAVHRPPQAAGAANIEDISDDEDEDDEYADMPALLTPTMTPTPQEQLQQISMGTGPEYERQTIE